MTRVEQRHSYLGTFMQPMRTRMRSYSRGQMYGTSSRQAFHGRTLLIICGNCLRHSATAPTSAGSACVFDPTVECCPISFCSSFNAVVTSAINRSQLLSTSSHRALPSCRLGRVAWYMPSTLRYAIPSAVQPPEGCSRARLLFRTCAG